MSSHLPQTLTSYVVMGLEPETPSGSSEALRFVSVPPDLTFLHESCKTFHGDLVNFEKMVSLKGGRLRTAASSLVLGACPSGF